MKYTGAKPASEVGAVPIIYIDVVFAVNFVMDGVLLLTTCWILHRPVQAWRLIAGAFIGAVYGLLLFFPAYDALTDWVGKAVMTFVMVGIAIKRRSWFDLARVCLVFFGVSFVFAGAAIGMHFALPAQSLTKVGVVNGNHISIETSMETLSLLVTLPIGISLTKYIVRRMRQTNVRAGLMYTVRATFGTNRVACIGLVDSGNQLRDPIKRRPVIFVDSSIMIPVLPQKLVDCALHGRDLVLALGELEQHELSTRFTVIPYRGAGGKQQLTIAIQPDEATFEREGHQFVAREPCLFALHPTRLSVDGKFQALLNIELVTGDEAFEVSRESAVNQHEITNSSPTVVDSNSAQITR